jgi:hypothetical protein
VQAHAVVRVEAVQFLGTLRSCLSHTMPLLLLPSNFAFSACMLMLCSSEEERALWLHVVRSETEETPESAMGPKHAKSVFLTYLLLVLLRRMLLFMA